MIACWTQDQAAWVHALAEYAFNMWRPTPWFLTSTGNPVNRCCLLILKQKPQVENIPIFPREFVITSIFTGSNKTNKIIRYCNIPQSLYNGQQRYSNAREDVLQIYPNARASNKMEESWELRILQKKWNNLLLIVVWWILNLKLKFAFHSSKSWPGTHLYPRNNWY